MESKIFGFHAHVYFHDEATRSTAAKIRCYTADNFQVIMGNWRDQPVGPHPMPMFQIAFQPEIFDQIVPWLMLNRAGLSVLVHPETGDDAMDHRDCALWLGERLNLDIAFLVALK